MSPAREHWERQDGRDAVRPVTPMRKAANEEVERGEEEREEREKEEGEGEEEGDEVRKKEVGEG